MFESLLKALSAGLSLWESKEKTKYVDRMLKLKKAYRAEYDKPREVRSDALMDNILQELRLTVDAWAQLVEGKKE